MVESTILVVAFVAGCVVLALRRERARGRNPDTLRGRIDGLGLGIFLLPVVLMAHGILGTNRWLTATALIVAGIAVVFAPRLAVKALPPILIALGLYGFVLVRGYQRGSQTPVLYGVLPAGRWSWPTYLILPQAYALLAVGLWLAWRQLGPRSRLATAVLWRRPAQPGGARRARWGLLLLPVLGMTFELLGQSWWFSVNGWGPGLQRLWSSSR
jgi:hypothetical protein